MDQELYTVTAGQVEPGWQLFIKNERWVDVGVVIETETPEGTHNVLIVFDDSTNDQAEPDWQLFAKNERWAVIEAETPEGTHTVLIVFDDGTKLPAVKLAQDAVVTARPPALPPNFE